MASRGMTKAELVEEVARTAQITKKHAELIVNTVFESIVNSLKEKLRVRKEGEMNVILNLMPRMNWRMKKNITDRMVTAIP